MELRKFSEHECGGNRTFAVECTSSGFLLDIGIGKKRGRLLVTCMKFAGVDMCVWSDPVMFNASLLASCPKSL